MPFRSARQRSFLWAKHPEVAERWETEGGTPANLPERVAKVRAVRSMMRTGKLGKKK
jgi:hypothetical protein